MKENIVIINDQFRLNIEGGVGFEFDKVYTHPKVKRIILTDDEWDVCLFENGLTSAMPYDTSSNINKKKLYWVSLNQMLTVQRAWRNIRLMIWRFHNFMKTYWHVLRLLNKIYNLRTDEVDTSGAGIFKLYGN